MSGLKSTGSTMSLNRAAMTGLSVLLVMSAVHCTVFAENAGKFPILEGDCVKLCGALLSEEGDELSDLVKFLDIGKRQKGDFLCRRPLRS